MSLDQSISHKVEDVTLRMTARCEGRKGRQTCGDLPCDKRLKVTVGSGRWAKTEVFCALCGLKELAELITEVSGLMTELDHEWEDME